MKKRRNIRYVLGTLLITKYNDQIYLCCQRGEELTTIEPVFQSQYAWIIVNLDMTNNALATALHELQSAQYSSHVSFNEMKFFSTTLSK